MADGQEDPNELTNIDFHVEMRDLLLDLEDKVGFSFLFVFRKQKIHDQKSKIAFFFFWTLLQNLTLYFLLFVEYNLKKKAIFQLQQGLIGFLDSSIDRQEWRRLLNETGDITSLIKGDVVVKTKEEEEIIYSHDELGRLNPVQKWAIYLAIENPSLLELS